MAAIEPDESAGDYGCYRIKGEYSIYFADIRDELRNGGTFKVKQGILERTPSFTIWIESISDDDLYFIAKEFDDESEDDEDGDYFIFLRVYNSERRAILHQIESFIHD